MNREVIENVLAEVLPQYVAPYGIAADALAPVLATSLVDRLAAHEGDQSEAVDWTQIERSLRKRLDDWMTSTSEFYARQADDSDRWRAGLVGYLLRGPGALDKVLTAQEGDQIDAAHHPSLTREAWDYWHAKVCQIGSSVCSAHQTGAWPHLVHDAIAMRDSAWQAQEGDQGEAVREALDEVERRITGMVSGIPAVQLARDAPLAIVREVRDRHAPQTGQKTQ